MAINVKPRGVVALTQEQQSQSQQALPSIITPFNHRVSEELPHQLGSEDPSEEQKIVRAISLRDIQTTAENCPTQRTNLMEKKLPPPNVTGKRLSLLVEPMAQNSTAVQAEHQPSPMLVGEDGGQGQVPPVSKEYLVELHRQLNGTNIQK
jgi:hypothetical protein